MAGRSTIQIASSPAWKDHRFDRGRRSPFGQCCISVMSGGQGARVDTPVPSKRRTARLIRHQEEMVVIGRHGQHEQTDGTV